MRAWNNLCGRRLTIVTYHRVTPKRLDQIENSLPTLFVTEDTFRKHLTFYKKYYKIIRFSDLAGYACSSNMPHNLLMITFDDGYEDNCKYGSAILNEYNAPWTLFVATDKVSQKTVMWWDRLFALLTHLVKKPKKQFEEAISLPSHLAEIVTQFRKNSSELFADFNRRTMDELLALIAELQSYCTLSEETLVQENSFLNWDQANRLYPSADIGSHTCSHTVLTGLPMTQVEQELFLSKETIQQYCHRAPLAFSYPAGLYAREMVPLVGKAGYQFAVTQDRGVNDLSDPYTLKRINVWEGSANLASGEFSFGFFAVRLLGII
jgi:peptidoglycan/xylan/chitin deacetylase (PgdA/CDA1 family)